MIKNKICFTWKRKTIRKYPIESVPVHRCANAIIPTLAASKKLLLPIYMNNNNIYFSKKKKQIFGSYSIIYEISLKKLYKLTKVFSCVAISLIEHTLDKINLFKSVHIIGTFQKRTTRYLNYW